MADKDPYPFLDSIDGLYRFHTQRKMLSHGSMQQLSDSKSLTLLLLPDNVRMKIYLYCGLIRPCPIDFHLEPMRRRLFCQDLATRYTRWTKGHRCEYPGIRSIISRRFDSFPPAQLECFCPSIPCQLLRVSREMHLEAEAVLYGMNQFKVSWHLNGYNLEVLRGLNPRVWALLTSLHISLSEVPPFVPGVKKQNLPWAIDVQDLTGQQILQDWTVASRDILSYISTHQLKFSLSCNVSNVETAREIVEPLYLFLPMCELSIRLATNPEQREIQRVAREASLRMKQRGFTNTASRSSSLSWTSLPRELRLDILSRTDLVDRPFPSRSQFLQPPRHGFEIAAGYLLPRARACCLSCTPTLSTCACAPIHVAFSTSCTCPTAPIAIFCVSKDMNIEATVIFFSRNRFILSGDFAANELFIRSRLSRNPTALRSIRMLDLKVSYAQLLDMRDPRGRASCEWAALVTYVASTLYLPNLWLSIDAGNLPVAPKLFGVNTNHHWLRSAYAALFAPLYVHMSGDMRPAKFHVFLWWWPEYEGKFEKRLMGEEYDSTKEGKLMWREREPSYPHSKEMARPIDYECR